MPSNCPHGSGLLTEPQDASDIHTSAAAGSEDEAAKKVVLPTAQLFEAPDWMKSYGMPLAISCSVGYCLVGLVMVEPTAPGALFHPAAILTLLLFAFGFVKGMQWWTTANESGKALICPHCRTRTRMEALARSSTSHTCRCGQDYAATL
jgi:hypothetical protein